MAKRACFEIRCLIFGLVLMSAALSAPAQASIYVQNILVSDQPGAAFQDPSLINPWGIVHSATSPWWVADNGTGVSSLYNGSGVPQALVVTVPPNPGGTPPSSPTGVVFNGTSSFGLVGGLNPARFLFATEEGTIAGWNPVVNPTGAVTMVDNSSVASYTGLAIGSIGLADFLYAANFEAGRVDVFDSTFSSFSAPGGFTDPSLPAGYSPFGIQNIGGNIYVTYAERDPNTGNEVKGAGKGIIDVFSTSGIILSRAVTFGALNAPWGIALAPSNFGDFSNDLLVGNFGDGRISAFDPANNFAFLGQLNDNVGPITLPGLWGIGFGNGANAGPLNALYFAAGPADETQGRFGNVLPAGPETVPEPSTALLFSAGLLLAYGWRRLRGLILVFSPNPAL